MAAVTALYINQAISKYEIFRGKLETV